MNKFIVDEMFKDDGSLIIREHVKHLFKEIKSEMLISLSISVADNKLEYDLFNRDLRKIDLTEVLNLIEGAEVLINYVYLKDENDLCSLNIYEISEYLNSKIKTFEYKLSVISDMVDSFNELYIYDERHHGLMEFEKIDYLDHGNWHMIDEILSYEANDRVKDNEEILDLLKELAKYTRIDMTNYYDSEIFDVHGDVPLHYDDLLKAFDLIAEILHLMFKDSEYEYIDFVYSNLDVNNFELLHVSFNFQECNYVLEKTM